MRWWQIKRRNADLERELRADLELEEEEQRASGLSAEEARHAAHRAFGNVTLIREHTHEAWGWAPFERLWQDLRYAARQLHKSPGFALTAVLTLAVGLGTTSAIFCLMDTLWLHPMRVPHSDELVRVFSTTPQDADGDFSYPEYQTFADRVRAFQSSSSELVAIGGRGSMMPQPDGTSMMLLTNVVSSNFFSVLGVHPLIGRLFTAQDETSMRVHPGVVLGFRCWQRNFSGDPNIVGRQISLEHGSHQRIQVDVWGVLPPSFREIDPASDRDLWMSAETWAAIANPKDLTSLDFRWFRLLGRLASGATVGAAQTQVEAVASALAVSDPVHNQNRGARVVSDFRYRMNQAGTSGLVLIGIVCGVILLSVTNMAHLLLARALTRGAEIALRLSLGASRWTVARQLIIENIVIGVLSLALGLGIALGLAAWLPHMLAQEPAMLNSVPGSDIAFHLDIRVLLFAFLVASVMMLLLALVPLTQAARAELLPVLQASAATRTAGRTSMLRHTAIWLQIGISFALLVSTGALVRSFLNTRTGPLGVTRDQVLVAFAQEPEAPKRDVAIANLNALPGVQHTAYAIRSPLMPSEGGIAAKVILPDHPELREPVEIKYNAVSPDFLDVIGTRIVRGRGFAPADDRNGPAVIIISQAMVHKYWRDKDPVGHVLHLPSFDHGRDLDARIVGVAEDAPINQIGEIPEPYMYLPFHLSQMGEITFVLETRQNAMSIARDARQVLIHVDPILDPMFITSLPELIRSSSGSYQMMAELVTAMGILGLALTFVGLYGFLAFRVTQRRREIGIRMALGASREATILLVFHETLRMAAVGLTIGLALSLLAARIETAALFGVSPLDAVSVTGALAVLAIAMIGAAWLPAQRAASVQPMEALRYD